MGKVFWLLLWPLVALAIAWCVSYQSTPKLGAIVATKSGHVQGIISISRDGREFQQWLGIPYAQPPIGPLRFSSPKPVLPWDGVRDGSRHGSRCAQHQIFFSFNPMDEDCLFLNVHAPKLDRHEKLPVMVFIHGGYFYVMGSDDYLPHYFMDEDVILVTVNYRLGLFGLMSMADKNVRGNMGLKDQALAMKWVTDNIERFGGDPERITIFGHSAGGLSAHLHMFNPKNSGLFAKVISQSGTATMAWLLEGAEDSKGRALQVAENAGCQRSGVKETVECLRNLPWKTLLEAEMKLLGNFEFNELHRDESTFMPVVEAVDDDEAFIVERPLDLISKGAILKVPWMAGVTGNEGLFGVFGFLNSPEVFEKFDSNWPSKVGPMLGLRKENVSALEGIGRRMRHFYFPPTDQQDASQEERPISQNIDRYRDLFSDLFFNFHLYNAAQIQKQFAPVHLYFYNQTEGISGGVILAATSSKLMYPLGFFVALLKEYFRLRVSGWLTKEGGVCHGDEQVVLFPINGWMSVTTADSDYQFSKDMVKLWVDFASKPESEVTFRGVKLPVQESNAQFLSYLELSDSPKIIPQPFEDRIKFLESLDYLKFVYKPKPRTLSTSS